jgi:serine/threonine-protein phosphatase 2B catalytic subunit
MTNVEKKKIDYTKRIVPEVVLAPNYYLKEEDLFKKDGKPNYEILVPHFQKEGRINPKHAIQIVDMAAKLLRQEANLLVVQDPITGSPTFHI